MDLTILLAPLLSLQNRAQFSGIGIATGCNLVNESINVRISLNMTNEKSENHFFAFH